MKLNKIIIPLIAVVLCGCQKTSRLYKLGVYESPNFYSNYYLKEDTKNFVISKQVNEIPLELSSIDGLDGLHQEDRGGYAWKSADKDQLWGYHNNLGLKDEKFKYGAISKLYDGRVRCDGLYQKSRAQLDKVGYSAMFPLIMDKCDYFAMSCRGGTTLLEQERNPQFLFNFTISFFTVDANNLGQYVEHIYKLDNVLVHTDNSGKTSLVSFYIDQSDDENGGFRLKNTVAMSFRWECVDSSMDTFNLTDDRKVKEKDHIAIMLYEVFLGNSTWH